MLWLFYEKLHVKPTQKGIFKSDYEEQQPDWLSVITCLCSEKSSK